MPEKEILRFFAENDNFLILTHSDPDADTIGSAAALVYGLEKLGKQACAACEKMPAKLAFIDENGYFGKPVPPDANCVICVDTATPEMLDYAKKYIDAYGIALVIDHHKINTLKGGMSLIRSDYSSCGEIVYELLNGLGIGTDKKTAVPLYAAISSDSGCFRFSATRPETLICAAELIRTGIDFAKINRFLFDTKRPEQIKLERIAYNSIELMCGGKLAVVVISEEDLSKAGACDADIDGLNQIPRRIEGVEVSALIRQKGGKVKISLRSNDYFDVANFASEHFGGGGHKHAAGCSLSCDVVTAKNMIADALRKELCLNTTEY